MHKYTKTIILVVSIIAAVFVLIYCSGKFFFDKISPVEITGEYNQNEDVLASVGKKAPYFNLLSSTGDRVHLSDLTEKGTVLTFWSSWSPDSVDQIKILDDYLSKNSSSSKQLPLNIVAINSQEQASSVVNFIHRGGYDLKVLIDENGETSNIYGVQTLPTTFFVDRSGVIQEIFIGTISEKMLVDKIEKIIN